MLSALSFEMDAYQNEESQKVDRIRGRAFDVHAPQMIGEIFSEHSLPLERQCLAQHAAGMLMMGDDRAKKTDEFSDSTRVVCLQSAPTISTAATVDSIPICDSEASN